MKPPARRWGWRFFPLRKGSEVPEEAVQAWLVHLLEVWGLPARVRVDNGWPWGSSQDLPPVLSLWLRGLGIEVIWNRPAHPQENGWVERFHGLLATWGEPERCADWDAWTQSVAQVVQVQREAYPAVEARSRLAAHPELRQNPRRFPPADEEAPAWKLAPVLQLLAGGLWRRQVGKKGQITLYHRPFSVGSRRAGQTVFVRLDPDTREWVVRDRQGQEIRRHAARELTAERIQALDISYRKPHEQRRRQQRPNPIAFYAT